MQVSGWDFSFVPPTRSSGSCSGQQSAVSGQNEDSDCSTSTYRPAEAILSDLSGGP